MMTSAELTCQELVELVTDYLDGTLSAEERRRVEEHLAECDYCLTYLEQMRLTVRLLAALETNEIPAESRDRLLEIFHRWRHSPDAVANSP